MSDARDDILAEIRAAASKDKGEALGPYQRGHFGARNRLINHPANLIPARGKLGKKGRVDLFIREAERANATVARVSCLAGVPGEVVRFLTKNNLPMFLKIAPEISEEIISWKDQVMLRVEEGSANGTEHSSVNRAFAGVAETGTLVVLSGQRSPTTLNFLPSSHICLVHASKIAGNYEEVWDRIRELKNKDDNFGFLPRTVNWITGPSRTADIEQTLLLGAHGPQRLHIVIVDD